MLTPTTKPEGQTSWPVADSAPAQTPTYPAARPGGEDGNKGDFDGDHPSIAARAHDQGSVWTTRGLMINIVIPLLILAAGFGFVLAIGSVEPKARPAADNTADGRLKRLPAAEVTKVYSLQEMGKPLELRVDGVVVPHREVQLAAEVAGRVIEKSPLCRAGNFVKAGQLLIKIDPTDYEQEVMRLSRMREQDYEALKEVDQEIENANMSLSVAKQDITLAEREVARLKSLPRGFVSEGEIDVAQKSLLQSTQNRIAIENQKNLLAARRGRLEAAERLATTQLETAKINLQRCEVRSVADGVIVREDAELNSFIQRGSPIVTLEDVSKAEVAVNLRMDQLYWVLDQNRDSRFGGVSVGDMVDAAQPEAGTGRAGYAIPPTPAVIEYEVSGMGGRTYRWNGTLVRYDGIGLDSRSRTVPVKIVVDQPNRLLQPDGGEALSASPSALVRGMYVSVRLLIKPQTPLVAIPSNAIRPGNRVWQFSVDPTVLTEPLADDATSVAADGDGSGQNPVIAANEPAPATVPAAQAAGDDFDPSLWTAGRVAVRGNLTPVDSLFVSESGDSPAFGPTDVNGLSKQRDRRRFWICDVQGSGIVGGDFVVTSPLGELGPDLGDAALSVRVKTESLKP